MQHRLDSFSQFRRKTTGLKIIIQDLQGVQTGGKKSARFNKKFMSKGMLIYPSLLTASQPFLPSGVHKLQIMILFVNDKNVKLLVILSLSMMRSK